MAIDKDGYIHIKWHIDDVKATAERMGITSGHMTDEDAEEILEIVERRHDANTGISWDVIEAHIDDYYVKTED